MKCLECNKSYEKSFSCPKCGHMPEKVKEAHKIFNSFANRDEIMRGLVTGLNILGLETEMSCEGGEGHSKPYPWVELRFTKNSDSMNRLQKILFAYHLSSRMVMWKVEKQVQGQEQEIAVFWLVPKNKQLPLSLLHEGVEELGWFLYQTR